MDISIGVFILFALILAGIIACIISLFVAKKQLGPQGPKGDSGIPGPASFDTRTEYVQFRAITPPPFDSEDKNVDILHQVDPVSGALRGALLYVQQSAAPNAANQTFTIIRGSFRVDFNALTMEELQTCEFSFDCPTSIPLPTTEMMNDCHLLGTSFVEEHASEQIQVGTFTSVRVEENSFRLVCRQMPSIELLENNIWKFQFQFMYMTIPTPAV